MKPPCEGYVPGYGDPNADFHLIRNRPDAGDADSNEGFVTHPGSQNLRSILQTVGLLAGTTPTNLFCSYRVPCPDPPEQESRKASQLQAVFDAELRAITAHVLVPVGSVTIETVLNRFSQVNPNTGSVESLHATELATGSWVILPLKEPAKWDTADNQAARDAFVALRSRDYRREADLGRHITGPESYFVR